MTCSNVEGSFLLEAVGTDDTFVYVYNDNDDEYYKLSFIDNKCTLATTEEKFNYRTDQIKNGWNNYYLYGNKIYFGKYYYSYNNIPGASGNELVEDAIYINDDGDYVENPVLKDISTYTRMHIVMYPTEYRIDKNEEYYYYYNLETVENPVLDDILDYVIIKPFDSHFKNIKQIDVDFDAIGEAYASEHTGLTYEHYVEISKVDGKFIFLLEFKDDG